MSELKIMHDYVGTRMLELDTATIKKSCYLMKDTIDKNFIDDKHYYDDVSAPVTSNVFMSYNLLMYPFDGFHDLFVEINRSFHAMRIHQKVEHTKFYIQCWLNVFKENQFLSWHKHWEPEFDAWHGFYCVQVGESSTAYILKDKTELTVQSQDNLLVLSKSDGDIHRSSPWVRSDMDRITIAFDILPDYAFKKTDIQINHWIPI